MSVHAGDGDGDGDGDDLDIHMQALGVSDGFRPETIDASSDDGATSESSEPSSSTSAPSPTGLAVPARTATASRPSSIAKPPQLEDSFALRHDGATDTNSVGPINQAFASRHFTGASSTEGAAEPPAESPYDGPSGPSFPYQMYPQNVRLARTLSVATSSTDQPSESSYIGPRGPAHPYGLYPQNTVAGPSAAIPVGFPGLADAYQRQMGPDGEEIADMIGPDGHTEQLPPYSRYPDEAYARKAGPDPEAAVPLPLPIEAGAVIAPVAAAAAASLQLPALVQPIPGAGGLGLAARNPEFDPLDDLDSPRSRHSSRSFTTASEASHHEINTAARAISEKPKPLKRWQVVARRRLFGIVPYWAICLLITALLLMGIILGGVIGAFYAKHKKTSTDDDR